MLQSLRRGQSLGDRIHRAPVFHLMSSLLKASLDLRTGLMSSWSYSTQRKVPLRGIHFFFFFLLNPGQKHIKRFWQEMNDSAKLIFSPRKKSKDDACCGVSGSQLQSKDAPNVKGCSGSPQAGVRVKGSAGALPGKRVTKPRSRGET